MCGMHFTGDTESRCAYRLSLILLVSIELSEVVYHNRFDSYWRYVVVFVCYRFFLEQNKVKLRVIKVIMVVRALITMITSIIAQSYTKSDHDDHSD